MTSKKEQVFIVIEKNGVIKEVSVKKITNDELYKKCSFRKQDGFDIRNIWENVKVDNKLYKILLFGKIEGKANTENKYEFPPPFDTHILFGNCALVRSDKNGDFASLTKKQWLKAYEVLFGGFDDIDDEDESEIDELDIIKKNLKTKKGGYMKDGFVVDSSDEEDNNSKDSNKHSDDDDDDDDDDDVDNHSDENSELFEKIKDTNTKKHNNACSDIELSCGSELEEEDYDYDSDD